jgi:hypothetical protein
MAHHFDVLIESHDPARLVIALLPCVMTGRAYLQLRIQVQLLAFTTIPWGSHEGCPVFDLMIPRSHCQSTPPHIRLQINALSEFYNGRKKSLNLLWLVKDQNGLKFGYKRKA